MIPKMKLTINIESWVEKGLHRLKCPKTLKVFWVHILATWDTRELRWVATIPVDLVNYNPLKHFRMLRKSRPIRSNLVLLRRRSFKKIATLLVPRRSPKKESHHPHTRLTTLIQTYAKPARKMISSIWTLLTRTLTNTTFMLIEECYQKEARSDRRAHN